MAEWIKAHKSKVFIWGGFIVIFDILAGIWVKSLSQYTDDFAYVLTAPFRFWLWMDVWLKAKCPHYMAAIQPLYDIVSLFLLSLLVGGILLLKDAISGKKNHLAQLCHDEIVTLLKKVDDNPTMPPQSLSQDIVDLTKSLEEQIAKMFSQKKVNVLCVWVIPTRDGDSNQTDWEILVARPNLDKMSFGEVLQPFILRKGWKKKCVQFNTDLTSFETDVKEVAFIRNAGGEQFKLALAVLFFDTCLSKENKSTLEQSINSLHLLARESLVVQAMSYSA